MVDWNILLFTKSVNHSVQQKNLKKGATSSTSNFGDQSILRAVDFRLEERITKKSAAAFTPSAGVIR
jgi:hypothetical protein